MVASREPAKHDSKKVVAAPPAHRAVAAASADNAPAGKAQGRWGVLKKRH